MFRGVICSSLAYPLASVVIVLSSPFPVNLNVVFAIPFPVVSSVLYISKLPKFQRLGYLNKIDAKLNTQRILLRIMKKFAWIDIKKFNTAMGHIYEIGKILGGLIKYYAKNNT